MLFKKRLYRALLSSVIFALYPARAHALETDGILWNQFFWQGPKEWRVRPFSEIQERLGGDMQKIEQILFRPAVVWAPFADTPQLTLWAGYGWTPGFNTEQSTWTTEHRAWQQFMYTLKLSDRIDLMARTRLEQRFLQGGFETGHRARQLVRMQYAFDAAKVWQFVVWDELFWQINTASDTVISGFNQNRILVGAYIKAYENFFVELGYLNVQTRQAAPRDFKISHGILLAAYTGL